jgi:hypothetical protein
MDIEEVLLSLGTKLFAVAIAGMGIAWFGIGVHYGLFAFLICFPLSLAFLAIAGVYFTMCGFH